MLHTVSSYLTKSIKLSINRKICPILVQGENSGGYIVDEPVDSAQQVLPGYRAAPHNVPMMSLNVLQLQYLQKPQFQSQAESFINNYVFDLLGAARPRQVLLVRKHEQSGPRQPLETENRKPKKSVLKIGNLAL